MIITHEEMQRRLNSSKNLTSVISQTQTQTKQDSKSGSHTDQKAVPENLRCLGASLVAQGVPEKQVSKELNIPVKDLRINPNDPADKEFSKRVQDSIDKVRELALSKMIIALGLMTPDKFENASLKDLTAATANLSRVIGQTSERESAGSTNVQFIVHVPPTKDIGQYRVIDI